MSNSTHNLYFVTNNSKLATVTITNNNSIAAYYKFNSIISRTDYIGPINANSSIQLKCHIGDIIYLTHDPVYTGLKISTYSGTTVPTTVDSIDGFSHLYTQITNNTASIVLTTYMAGGGGSS